MNPIESYQVEIERMFAEAAEEMNGLPVGLREAGQALLERAHPLRNGGGTNVISYLLPYWFGEWTARPAGVIRDLAVGHIYAMLHFFLLDDAMDGDGGRRGKGGLRVPLALGQLLYGLFQDRYRRHFPQESLLWTAYRGYLAQWAATVSTEQLRPIDPADPAVLAGKAAPVKLGAAGMLLHAGRPEDVAEAEHAVDLALAVLQLSDDWADWREDLTGQEANGNAFLSIARETLRMQGSRPLEEPEVKRAIYSLGAADRLAVQAEDYAERLMRMPDLPARLVLFAQSIARDLREEANKIEDAVEALAQGGGFENFFSKYRE